MVDFSIAFLLLFGHRKEGRMCRNVCDDFKVTSAEQRHRFIWLWSCIKIEESRLTYFIMNGVNSLFSWIVCHSFFTHTLSSLMHRIEFFAARGHKSSQNRWHNFFTIFSYHSCKKNYTYFSKMKKRIFKFVFQRSLRYERTTWSLQDEMMTNRKKAWLYFFRQSRFIGPFSARKDDEELFFFTKILFVIFVLISKICSFDMDKACCQIFTSDCKNWFSDVVFSSRQVISGSRWVDFLTVSGLIKAVVSRFYYLQHDNRDDDPFANKKLWIYPHKNSWVWI